MSTQLLTKFNFMVEWGGTRLGFTEVSGLATEYDVIEYRDGYRLTDDFQKIRGLAKYCNLILKRGMIESDLEFYNSIIKWSLPRNITIKLLDEARNPLQSWLVKNAMVIKYATSDLNAKSSEVAIESLELVHDGFEIIL